MTRRQKLELRRHEIVTRLNEIGDVQGEAYSEEIRSEESGLKTELRQVDGRIETALLAEGEDETRMAAEFGDDPEGRELRALIGGASMGAIFTAALEHRATDGREAELQAHYKIGPNQVPLAMLRSPVETRAVTPAPANVGQQQAQIIAGVFPMACATFLGVGLPTAGVGEAVYPVLTKNADVGTPAENAAQAETTGSFSAEVLSPSRLQASYFYSREDRARFAGMDSALRSNLSDALSDSLDKQILAGTDGLFTGTNLANHNVTAETNYAGYRADFLAGRVDGRFAMTYDDLRIVLGSGTFAHADSVWRGTNTNNDVSALDVLSMKAAGLKVSAHVPAVASNKQNAVVRLGMRRDAVAPIWEGITLIADEVTKAGSGQIVVTAVMLYAFKILRAGGFYKQQSQHA